MHLDPDLEGDLPLRHFWTPLVLAIILAVTLMPVDAQAQDVGITLALSGGVGGSPDSDGYGGSGFQLLAGMEFSPRTLTAVRFGELSTDLEFTTDSATFVEDADLTYLTVGTEYRRGADYYDSGLFIGIGYYKLEGTRPSGLPTGDLPIDEDSLGLSMGVTGDFRINKRFSALVEISGHYADFDDVQFFLMGHVGLAFKL